MSPAPKTIMMHTPLRTVHCHRQRMAQQKCNGKLWNCPKHVNKYNLKCVSNSKIIIWATAHTSGTNTSNSVWKHPIKPDVINDCFLDPSFTLNTTVLLAVPVSESASNTHCMHSICELIADFKKKEISATMELFLSNLANQNHPPLCACVAVSQHHQKETEGRWCVMCCVSWRQQCDIFEWSTAACRKCIMRAEWRHERYLWEIPEWGAIYSLTDEAGQGEWATLECSGVCLWVVDGVREQERGSARESEYIRMSVQWL